VVIRVSRLPDVGSSIVTNPGVPSLTQRRPVVPPDRLLAELVPPRHFADESFATYRPDPAHPSQAAAVTRLSAAAEQIRRGGQKSFWKRGKATPVAVYLDGGFGVGKTHLLAALWHVAPGPKYFGTFIEYTALVGALGYAPAVELLRGARLLCIDEFELDDPGDTMLMTRFLGELMAGGTRVAATSNTPPNALGEGRFAAADFLREIHGLAANFETLRIDGLDYRRRDTEGHAEAVGDDAAVEHAASALAGRGHRVSLLATVHPSKYIKLIEGVEVIALTGVHELTDQNAALRLVAFIDRVYDAEVPVVASGTPLDAVFGGGMLDGGYRKKYQRSMSRMIALTTGELPPHD
jgi:cell division protein ZapE